MNEQHARAAEGAAQGGRRARRQAELRARLLEAGRQIFAHYGVEEATITQITQAADVGFGTFYLYFPTKEALYRAVVSQGFAALQQELDALRGRALEGGEPWRTALRAGVEAFFRFASANRELLTLMFVGHEGKEGPFSGDFRTHLMAWARTMVRAAARAEGMGDEPHGEELIDLLAISVIVMLRRFAVWWLRTPEGAEQEDGALPIATVSDWISRYLAGGFAAVLHGDRL